MNRTVRISFFFALLLAIATQGYSVSSGNTPVYPAIRSAAQESHSTLPPEANPVLAELYHRTGQVWSGYARNDGIAAWRVMGTGLFSAIPASESEAYHIGEAILLPILEKVYGTPITLQPLSANHAGTRWYIHFRQTIQGIPVHNGTVSVHIDGNGRVTSLQLGIANPNVAEQYVGMGTLAAKAAFATTPGGKVTTAVPVWLLQDGNFQDGPALRAAYYVESEIASDNRPVGYIDAKSGEFIGGWNRVNFEWISANAQGFVWNRYLNDPAEMRPFRDMNISLNSQTMVSDSSGTVRRFVTGSGQNINANGFLEGPFANVAPIDTSDHRAFVDTTGNVDVTLSFRVPPAFASETNLFWHMNFVHHWYKQLDPQYNALDYSMNGGVEIPNYDNAYWNGEGIYFGSGAATFRNLAMFCDVIYHEYTHGVTDGIYPEGMLPYTGQPGAMNEAWSDFFACTITDEPQMGEGGLYIAGGIMRNLINNRRFPGSFVNQVHTDGMIISASMWETRVALGADYTDSLLHFSKYALAETFFDYFVDILEHDDRDGNLANGTPHSTVLYQTFGNHGIGPGEFPNLAVRNLNYRYDGQGGSIGDGDRYFEPNESMAVSFYVKNDLTLYPPPATNTTIRFECSDAGLSLPQTIQAGTMNARDSIIVGPLLFQQAVGGNPRYAMVRIVRQADNGYTAVDSFRILLGKPNLAVISVDTSALAQPAYFVGVALDSLQIPYFATAADSSSLRLALLQDHSQIIWLGGSNRTIANTSELIGIQSFLDRGGKLLLSSQHLSALRNNPALLQDLHCTIESDSIHRLIVNGNRDLPLTAPRLYLSGSSGASNQSAMDVLAPTFDGNVMYRYDVIEAPVAAVCFGNEPITGPRTVVMGFGIEAVHQGSTSYGLAQMLSPILQWFDGTLDAPETPERELPTTFAMSCYPNPFNAELQVRLTLPQAGNYTVTLTDITGRAVWSKSMTVATGTTAFQVNGTSFASGLYFLHATTPVGSSIVKKVTLLK
ncbi:MAG: T9SS type A sorting domain-containing protein [bacterium]|nr:T9SS type A sorting domain-containing protein [bacterium]